MAAGDHLVVYDQSGVSAAALLAVLEWAGATDVSYLDGGIEGWHAAGYHTTTAPAVREARAFGGAARPERLVSSDALAKLLGQPGVVVVDTRAIHRLLGETRHAAASRAGAIPGAISFPVTGLVMDNGVLKPPEELLWLLRTRGITPDKVVVTTCDTGIAAADAYFFLRWLGFPDVRVHEEAWVGWSKTR
jgi:thiosulfate/3-mercaptopyruvate sulfurtransferase